MKPTNQGYRRAVGASVVVLAATSVLTAADCNRFKIWTFNVRFFSGSCVNELDAWDHCVPGEDRRERVRSYMTAYDPDIFGLQEVRPGQFSDIRSWFPDFTYGQYGGFTTVTARVPIFWRRTRFSDLAAGTFWLSCQPDQPGSQHPSANEERPVNWVKLRHLEMSTDLYVFNTHWPLVTEEEARKYSAALLRARIEQLAGSAPVVVLGDLNTTEDEIQFSMLTGQSAHPTAQFLNADCLPFVPEEVPLSALTLFDGYRRIDPVNDALDESTFHSFTGRPDYGSSAELAGKRVDFVVYNSEPGSEGLRAADACIRRDSFAGTLCEGCLDPVTDVPSDGCPNPAPPSHCCYPSDHFAVDLDLWLLLQDSWVDFTASGCETGRVNRPFNTVAEGIRVVRPNGTLRIEAGSTPDGVTINPGFPMTVRAVNGSVVIGE